MSFVITANLQLNPASLAAARNAAARAFGGGGGARRFTGALNNGLGQITEKATEFGKSMNAATARVFAFGATAAVLQGVKQGFAALLSNLIEVEKQLTLIKSTFGNKGNFGAFREDVFKTAQLTGTSFKDAADAALEFARQGLGAEETSKRLSAALTLSQVAGYDTTKSVEVLTAAINGYADAGTDAAAIVNKLVAVDTNYAVSSKDLAEALFRAGASANDAGVKFNDFLGLVTAVQQKTARGGAVIGNAFKTIFTRLSDTGTINSLRDLGVAIDSSQTGTEKLNAVAEALGKISDPGISANIKKLVGSTYQINAVTALLDDLQQKQNSITSGASGKAAGSSNEAFKKSAELAETLDVKINAVILSYQNLAEKIGQSTLAEPLKNVLGIVGSLAEVLNKALDPEKGSKAIQYLFKGIGTFIAGPGLLLIAGAFAKIGGLIFNFAREGLREVLQLGSATERFVKVQAEIGALLQNDANLYRIVTNSAVSRATKEQAVLNAINNQNAALIAQRDIYASLAAFVGGRGVYNVGPGGGFVNKAGKTPRFATGYIPASMKMEEAMAVMMGAPANVKAKFGKGRIGGKRFIMNNKELEIPNAGKNGDSAVIPLYAGGYDPFDINPAKQRLLRKPLPNPFVNNVNLSSQAGVSQAGSSIPGFASFMAASLATPLIADKIGSPQKDEVFEQQKLSKATKNLEELNKQIDELAKNKTIDSERQITDLSSKRLEIEREIANSELRIQDLQKEASSGWTQTVEAVKQLVIFIAATAAANKLGGAVGGAAGAVSGFLGRGAAGLGVGAAAAGGVGGALAIAGTAAAILAPIAIAVGGVYLYEKAQEKAAAAALLVSDRFKEAAWAGQDLAESLSKTLKSTSLTIGSVERTSIGARIQDSSSALEGERVTRELINTINSAINPEARAGSQARSSRGFIPIAGEIRAFQEGLFSEPLLNLNKEIRALEENRFKQVTGSSLLQNEFDIGVRKQAGRLFSPAEFIDLQNRRRDSEQIFRNEASNANNIRLEALAKELVSLSNQRGGKSLADFNAEENDKILKLRRQRADLDPNSGANREILGAVPELLGRILKAQSQSEITKLTTELLRESQLRILSASSGKTGLDEKDKTELVPKLQRVSEEAQAQLSKTVESLSSSLDFLRQNIEKQNNAFSSSAANLSSFFSKREGLSDLTSSRLRNPFGGKASNAQQNIDLLNTYFQKLTSGLTDQTEIARIRSSLASSINPKNAAQSREELNITAADIQKRQLQNINTSLETSLFFELLKTGFRGVRGAGGISNIVGERERAGDSPQKVFEDLFKSGSEEVRTQLVFLGEAFKQIADIDATETRQTLEDINSTTKELGDLVPLLQSSLDPIPGIWDNFAKQLETPISFTVQNVVKLSEVSGDLVEKLDQIVTNIDAANIRIASATTSAVGPKKAIDEQLPVE